LENSPTRRVLAKDSANNINFWNTGSAAMATLNSEYPGARERSTAQSNDVGGADQFRRSPL
jgi:hypothetical protein